ncbi:MAG: peptidylprolyl isomerase [Pseudomonadota bacterium]
MKRCLRVVCCIGVALSTAWAPAAMAQETSGADGTTAEKPSTRETVIARVGSSALTLGELIAYRATLPPRYLELPDEVLFQTILESLIEQTLLENAAVSAGVEQTPAARLMLRNARRRVLASSYINAMIEARVTETSVAALYDRTYRQAAPVSEVRTSHILVDDQGTADALLAQLEAGANFAAVAARHSRDATATRGGDRGWLSEEEMSPDFAAAVRDLPIGDLSDAVSTPSGWHIIRMDGKRVRPVPQLEDVSGKLEAQIVADLEREILKNLKASVGVEIMTQDVSASVVRDDALLREE